MPDRMPPEDPGAPAPPPLDPEQVLREGRARFVAGLPRQLERIEQLLGETAPAGREELRRLVHRMAGFGGTVGFPSVSARAAELEGLIDDPGFDVALARHMTGALREAFTRDLASPPPWPLAAPSPGGRPLTVLVVEDNPDHADVLISHLEAAGHRSVLVTSGDAALAAALAASPDVTLLDVELPGLDGFSVCRLMKAEPALTRAPIIFMTTRSRLDDRMAGLTLGADDYLTKPVDVRELLLRLRLLAGRVAARADAARPPAGADTLDYAEFLERVRPLLASSPGSLALVRVPYDRADAAARIAGEELRRRDLVGRYDTQHLVVWLPDTLADAAVDRLRALVARLAALDVAPVHAGVASSPAPGTAPIESLLLEADEALGEARGRGEPASRRTGRPAGPTTAPGARPRRVLIAEDDPDVVRVIDSQLRAAGYDTAIAFDGRQAVELARTAAPDVLVLDLMMPRMSGFDVIGAIRSFPSRPGIVVLSARGREEDVTRALDMGADDYMVKPFSPQELRTRIGRLLRHRD